MLDAARVEQELPPLISQLEAILPHHPLP